MHVLNLPFGPIVYLFMIVSCNLSFTKAVTILLENVWDENPEMIKECTSFNNFKKLIKDALIEQV